MLWGHTTQHVDPRQCPVGAFGFCLLMQMHITDECGCNSSRSNNCSHCNDDDRCSFFLSNHKWFDRKLLIDAYGSKASWDDKMCDDAYACGVKSLLGDLLIALWHYFHLGRVLGPVLLEIEGFSSDEIRNLGNWNSNVQETRYSSCLPLLQMKGIAGFANKPHYNPCTMVKVPASLQQLIFPFVESKLQMIEQSGGQERLTAKSFLELLIMLCTVIVQDAAAIFALHPDHSEHRLF